MDRGTSAIVVVGAIVVVLAIAALFGGTRVEIETGTGVSLEIPTDGSAIVHNKFQGGGLKLLGVRIQQPDYTVDIALTVPEDCIDDDGAGDRTLRGDGACANLPISGPIDGGGITAEGDHTAILRLTLDEDCFEALTVGGSWPSSEPACADA